jgi:hypothetical protein
MFLKANTELFSIPTLLEVLNFLLQFLYMCAAVVACEICDFGVDAYQAYTQKRFEP